MRVLREPLGRKPLLHWAELAVLVALVAGVLVLINFIAYRHNQRFDLTPEKVFSLSPQTEKILSALEDDLMITVFYRRKDRDALLELMELLSRASGRVRHRFVEMDKNPALAKEMGVSRYGAGMMEYKGRRERFSYFTEENIVSAIIRLTEKSRKIVRFVRGHGEKEISSFDAENGYNVISQSLEAENYRVEEILLAQAGEVPEDTLVLVAAGPQKDFLPQEMEMVDRYVRRGGRVMLLCDPAALPVVEKYLQGLSVSLSRDFIIDTRSKLVGMDYLTPIVAADKSHPIARYMNEAVVFPLCRSVIPLGSDDSAVVTRILAQSGPDSWSERDKQSVFDGRVSFDEAVDLRGPVPVAVAVQLETGERPGHLIVMGDSDFAANTSVGVLGNKDFFMNTVNWLAEKSELLSARPRAAQGEMTMLFLTINESRLLYWSAMIIEPGLVLLAGLGVLLWRRFKR